MAYYCEADDSHKLTIHRGGKEGPVIATAVQCLEKDGVTEIHMFEPLETTVCIEHVHRRLPFFHGKTSFTFGGKNYHWKGHSALIEDDSGILLAALHATILVADYHKLGTLIVVQAGQKLLDLVVVSCLVMLERSDEGKLAVCPASG